MSAVLRPGAAVLHPGTAILRPRAAVLHPKGAAPEPPSFEPREEIWDKMEEETLGEGETSPIRPQGEAPPRAKTRGGTPNTDEVEMAKMTTPSSSLGLNSSPAARPPAAAWISTALQEPGLQTGLQLCLQLGIRYQKSRSPKVLHKQPSPEPVGETWEKTEAEMKMEGETPPRTKMAGAASSAAGAASAGVASSASADAASSAAGATSTGAVFSASASTPTLASSGAGAASVSAAGAASTSGAEQSLPQQQEQPLLQEKMLFLPHQHQPQEQVQPQEQEQFHLLRLLQPQSCSPRGSPLQEVHLPRDLLSTRIALYEDRSHRGLLFMMIALHKGYSWFEVPTPQGSLTPGTLYKASHKAHSPQPGLRSLDLQQPTYTRIALNEDLSPRGLLAKRFARQEIRWSVGSFRRSALQEDRSQRCSLSTRITPTKECSLSPVRSPTGSLATRVCSPQGSPRGLLS